jgi:Lon protease-like protein
VSSTTPSGVYRLPLFPLPLVLFPGAALPLHVFEPRYRQLLRDVQAGDGRFGIVVAAGPGAPAAGLVGCVAEVRDAQTLPDGRSNLVVDGGVRFSVVRLVDTDRLYAVAEVAPYADLRRADAELGEEGGATFVNGDLRVRALFARVARAAAQLADSDAPPPALPDDEDLAFAVAARVEFELRDRQRILESRSPEERLALVGDLLERAVGDVEARARVHTGARSNGRGPHA